MRCKYDAARTGIVEREGWNEQLEEKRYAVRWNVKTAWSYEEFGSVKRFDADGRPVLQWRFAEQLEAA